MDIWHTADTTGTGDGWIGRYYDSECCGFGAGESGARPNGGQRDGNGLPPHGDRARSAARDAGPATKPVAFETPDLFRWTGEQIHESLARPLRGARPAGPAEAEGKVSSNAEFLMRTSLDAQVSSDKIRRAVAERSLVEYPGTPLARS
jgi:hypothetical protein